MLTNYLEMIQSVERDREALLFSDRVYTYGNLADLALEKQKQLHLENRKQQLAVIRDACEFALEDDATLSYAEEKQLQSVQEQIELLLPQQTQEQRPTMEQTM